VLDSKEEADTREVRIGDHLCKECADTTRR
jgi:hypothetical protein